MLLHRGMDRLVLFVHLVPSSINRDALLTTVSLLLCRAWILLVLVHPAPIQQAFAEAAAAAEPQAQAIASGITNLSSLTNLLLLLCRGMDPFGAGPSAPIQQAFPEAEAAAEPQARAKTTRRTFPPRHLEGDEDYNSADGEGKNGRKRRYRVAEVRGSWSPEEDATLMQ